MMINSKKIMILMALMFLIPVVSGNIVNFTVNRIDGSPMYCELINGSGCRVVLSNGTEFAWGGGLNNSILINVSGTQDVFLRADLVVKNGSALFLGVNLDAISSLAVNLTDAKKHADLLIINSTLYPLGADRTDDFKLIFDQGNWESIFFRLGYTSVTVAQFNDNPSPFDYQIFEDIVVGCQRLVSTTVEAAVRNSNANVTACIQQAGKDFIGIIWSYINETKDLGAPFGNNYNRFIFAGDDVDYSFGFRGDFPASAIFNSTQEQFQVQADFSASTGSGLNIAVIYGNITNFDFSTQKYKYFYFENPGATNSTDNMAMFFRNSLAGRTLTVVTVISQVNATAPPSVWGRSLPQVFIGNSLKNASELEQETAPQVGVIIQSAEGVPACFSNPVGGVLCSIAGSSCTTSDAATSVANATFINPLFDALRIGSTYQTRPSLDVVNPFVIWQEKFQAFPFKTEFGQKGALIIPTGTETWIDRTDRRTGNFVALDINQHSYTLAINPDNVNETTIELLDPLTIFGNITKLNCSTFTDNSVRSATMNIYLPRNISHFFNYTMVCTGDDPEFLGFGTLTTTEAVNSLDFFSNRSTVTAPARFLIAKAMFIDNSFSPSKITLNIPVRIEVNTSQIPVVFSGIGQNFLENSVLAFTNFSMKFNYTNFTDASCSLGVLAAGTFDVACQAPAGFEFASGNRSIVFETTISSIGTNTIAVQVQRTTPLFLRLKLAINTTPLINARCSTETYGTVISNTDGECIWENVIPNTVEIVTVNPQVSGIDNFTGQFAIGDRYNSQRIGTVVDPNELFGVVNNSNNFCANFDGVYRYFVDIALIPTSVDFLVRDASTLNGINDARVSVDNGEFTCTTAGGTLNIDPLGQQIAPSLGATPGVCTINFGKPTLDLHEFSVQKKPFYFDQSGTFVATERLISVRMQRNTSDNTPLPEVATTGFIQATGGLNADIFIAAMFSNIFVGFMVSLVLGILTVKASGSALLGAGGFLTAVLLFTAFGLIPFWVGFSVITLVGLLIANTLGSMIFGGGKGGGTIAES